MSNRVQVLLARLLPLLPEREGRRQLTSSLTALPMSRLLVPPPTELQKFPLPALQQWVCPRAQLRYLKQHERLALVPLQEVDRHAASAPHVREVLHACSGCLLAYTRRHRSSLQL